MTNHTIERLSPQDTTGQLTSASRAQTIEPAPLAEVDRDRLALQRSADEAVNDPQRRANSPRNQDKILHLEVLSGGPEPVIDLTDYSRSSTPSVRFTIDRSSGHPMSGQVDTGFGVMTLEGENLQRACAEAARSISVNVGDYDPEVRYSLALGPALLRSHLAKVVAA